MYGIAQVQPVAGLVEVEAARLVGARVPAEARLLLEQQPGPPEVKGGRDPGQTAAQDHHPRVRVRGLHRRAFDNTAACRAKCAPSGGRAPGVGTLAPADLAQLPNWRALARSLRTASSRGTTHAQTMALAAAILLPAVSGKPPDHGGEARRCGRQRRNGSGTGIPLGPTRLRQADLPDHLRQVTPNMMMAVDESGSMKEQISGIDQSKWTALSRRGQRPVHEVHG